MPDLLHYAIFNIIFEFSFVESNIIILTKIEKPSNSSPIHIITTAYLLVIW